MAEDKKKSLTKDKKKSPAETKKKSPPENKKKSPAETKKKSPAEDGKSAAEDGKKRRNKILIILLLVISAAAINVSIWAVWFRQTAAEPSDYAPQQEDTNAEPIGKEETDEKFESTGGGGAVSLIYAKEVTLDLSTKEAEVLFQNPSKSNQDMALQLVIDGKVIARSEKLPVGYKLTKLTKVDTEKLSAGTYGGKFVVLYYSADTGEKAIINTEIPVTIAVK